MREGGTMEAADQQLWYLENVEQEIFALLTDMEELYLGANNIKAVSKVHDEMEDLNLEMRATTDRFDQFASQLESKVKKEPALAAGQNSLERTSSSTSNTSSLDAIAQPFMLLCIVSEKGLLGCRRDLVATVTPACLPG